MLENKNKIVDVIIYRIKQFHVSVSTEIESREAGQLGGACLIGRSPCSLPSLVCASVGLCICSPTFYETQGHCGIYCYIPY